MTKQKEIREALGRDIGFGIVNDIPLDLIVETVLGTLDSQGAVIKVKRSHDSDCSVHNMPAYQNGPCDCVELPAGCVAVEPLIGEEEHE